MVGPTRGRLRQGLLALSRRGSVALPPTLRETPRTACLFVALAPHDQHHLTSVHAACVGRGLTPDVATAGLLHDIGKASLSGRRVTVAERAATVLARGIFSRRLCQVLGDPVPGVLLGLALAVRHDELGTGRLSALGWPGSVVDIVLAHERDDLAGDVAELKRIDDATP